MTKTVLCRAPLTGALIDTNKGVRPCCVYDNTYLGNIKEDSLVKIINGTEWKKLKEQMYNHEWPVACLPCKQREDISGWIDYLKDDGRMMVHLYGDKESPDVTKEIDNLISQGWKIIDKADTMVLIQRS